MTTPAAAFEIHTVNEITHVHLLFALLDRNLGMYYYTFVALRFVQSTANYLIKRFNLVLFKFVQILHV